MKKLRVYCTFDTFDFYISEPNGRNPLFFQIWYLTNMRGGILPQYILKALNDLLKLSRETNSNFEELVTQALDTLQLVVTGSLPLIHTKELTLCSNQCPNEKAILFTNKYVALGNNLALFSKVAVAAAVEGGGV